MPSPSWIGPHFEMGDGLDSVHRFPPASEGVRMAVIDVLTPTSPDEAVAAFGDGTGVVVLGGGTIVVPEMTYGRLKPERVLMLGRAGLAGISRSGATVTIGAATPVADLVGLAAP